MSVGLVAVWLCSCGSSGEPRPHTAEECAALERMNGRLLRLDTVAVRLCDSIMASTTDSLTYYDYYMLKGRQCLLTSTPEDVLHYVRRTRSYASRLPLTPRTSWLLAMANSAEASYNHLMRRNHEHVVGLNTDAYHQMLQSDMKSYAPDMAANLADAYIYLNDLPSAAKWYRRAMFLVDSLKLPRDKNVTLYMGLAQIYTAMDDYASARHYYEMTEHQYATMMPHMQTYFLNNYGNCCYFEGKYADALDKFLRMRAHLDSIGAQRTSDMHLCLINLSDIYLNLGMPDSAEACVDVAGHYFEAHGVAEGVCYANAIRLGIALERGDHAAAARLVAAAPPTEGVSQGIKNIRSRYLRQYYEDTGQYRLAYEERKANQTEIDSMAHNRHNMRTAEIMMRFTEDTLKLHHQLALHERDAIVARSRTIMVLTVSVALVLAMAMLIWWMHSRKRWLQVQMETMKLRLGNTRRRISPHFMFNVLNMSIGHANAAEADALLRLARLLRSNLDMTTRPAISLREELAFIDDYVALERKLIGEDFAYELTAPSPEEQECIMLPTMLVQILVENAIKHGLKCITGPKRLAVEVTATATHATISVSDNGPGFDLSRTEGKPGKNGLHIIRQTIAIINHHNHGAHRMHFSIGSVIADDGSIAGCRATLIVPRTIKFI